MFSNIKFSAIFVGTFVNVTFAMIFFFFFAFASRLLEQSQNKGIFALCLMIFLVITRALAYCFTGYITARVAKTQPILHGFICGILAILFSAYLGNNLFLSFFISLPAISTGAWIYKIKHV